MSKFLITFDWFIHFNVDLPLLLVNHMNLVRTHSKSKVVIITGEDS